MNDWMGGVTARNTADIANEMERRRNIKVTELEALNAKQSERIAKLEKMEEEIDLLHAQGVHTCRFYLKRAETAEAENVKLREALRHIQKNDPI